MSSSPEVDELKVLFFAHVPPPLHGQSRMVELLLDGFSGREDLDIAHINFRLSSDEADVGSVRPFKMLSVFKFCFEAIVLRLRRGRRILYYVPTPAKRGSLVRDWIVMILLRPFYPVMVFHWHSVGLGTWLSSGGASRFERWLTRLLLGRHRLSVILSEAGREDVGHLLPREIAVVPNGIPDPLQTPISEIVERRRARLEKRKAGGDDVRFQICYVGLCSEDKGIFDALEAVALLEKRFREEAVKVNLQFLVAGPFPSDNVRRRFDAEAAKLDGRVRYLGMVGGEEKRALFEDSDGFCFPTYYANEGQPLTLLEAMAHGLPVVSTQWRGIPETMPEGYPLLVETHAPDRVADALYLCAREFDAFDGLRAHFEANYEISVHVQRVEEALRVAARGPE